MYEDKKSVTEVIQELCQQIQIYQMFIIERGLSGEVSEYLNEKTFQFREQESNEE